MSREFQKTNLVGSGQTSTLSALQPQCKTVGWRVVWLRQAIRRHLTTRQAASRGNNVNNNNVQSSVPLLVVLFMLPNSTFCYCEDVEMNRRRFVVKQ